MVATIGKILASLIGVYFAAFFICTVHYFYRSKALPASVTMLLFFIIGLYFLNGSLVDPISIGAALVLICILSVFQRRTGKLLGTASKDVAIAKPSPVEVLSRWTTDERQQLLDRMVLYFLRRAKYSKLVLSVAFIRTEDEKLVLCKLKAGEFEGSWFFPSGYVDPKNKEEYNNPKLKAEFEVEKYLNVDLDNENEFDYSGELTEVVPLEIDYGNPGYVEARIYEYVLRSREILNALSERSDFQIIEIRQLALLEGDVCPVLGDVLKWYKDARRKELPVPETFEKRIDEHKETRKDNERDIMALAEEYKRLKRGKKIVLH